MIGCRQTPKKSVSKRWADLYIEVRTLEKPAWRKIRNFVSEEVKVGTMTEIDVEKLIADSALPNPEHKRRLRELLFGQEARELSLDELAAVAGGVNLPEDNDEQWAHWPVQEDNPE